jgi:hypothetical protein
LSVGPFPTIPIPALAVGIGLKPPHYSAALEGGRVVDFFEIHAENFMGAGGPPHRWLQRFREQYPISIHGVCLSVGGRDSLDCEHLARLATLVSRYEPALVSEHLAWSADGGFHFNDLLPPPLTEKSLRRISDHVDRIQTALKRQVLIENPSSYFRIEPIGIPEPQFLNELAAQTGCGLLLDINNVFVSASNLEFDAVDYIDAIDASRVHEIHLAGHAVELFRGVVIRVDNHGDRAGADVLRLYERFLLRAGPRPTLFEWDTNLPTFDVLAHEASKSLARMKSAATREAIDDAL